MRLAAGEGRMAANRVTAIRRFDFDDLGAHAGEHLAAHRTGEHFGEFKDLKVVEGLGRSGGQALSPPAGVAAVNYSAIVEIGENRKHGVQGR